MARESKFDRLERERGKPIAEILVEALNEHGSVAKAAVALGITYRHVLDKMDELGIARNVQYQLPERERA